jgi:inositol oxygenase
MNESDQRKLAWVRKFTPYDLYSKAEAPPPVARLRPFYEELIAEFFPAQIKW